MKLFVQLATCTKFIWCSYYRSLIDTLASEVKCLRVIKKSSKQRAEYLQKQDDILSQENKANPRARYKADPEKKASVRDSYKADPEKKKASVRDSYKADPEKKKASVRDSYNADIESKQSAKRQRYQEDVEENRAAKRQKYEDNSAAIKASERNRYWNDPAVRLAKRAAERKRYRMGHRTTTTTQRYIMACCIALALKKAIGRCACNMCTVRM